MVHKAPGRSRALAPWVKSSPVRPYNTVLLHACGDTEGLGPETSRLTWSLVECLDYYAETECGHTFPETAAGLLGDKMLPGISEVLLGAFNPFIGIRRRQPRSILAPGKPAVVPGNV